MLRFQTLIKTPFLNLQGHSLQCQQRKLSEFLVCYQQFASLAYYGATGPVYKMESQQDKAFCVLDYMNH
jgi:hypothetical protein